MLQAAGGPSCQVKAHTNAAAHYCCRMDQHGRMQEDGPDAQDGPEG